MWEIEYGLSRCSGLFTFAYCESMIARTLYQLFLCAVILLASYASGLGQGDDDWREGCYRGCEDFWKGEVAITGPFAFRAVGGLGLEEHYMVNQVNTSIFKNMWAVYQTGDLYLNMDRLGMGRGFVRVKKPRTYTYFTGAPRNNREERSRRASAYGLAGGLIGGLIGVAVDEALAPHTTPKVPYLLNLETGQINELTERHMLRILEPYPRLYNAYRIDDGRLETEIALLYIELLNDLVEYGE